MSKIEHLPSLQNTNDLNNSISFSSKKVSDISKFSTIKNLSAYKTDAEGNLWKLGMLANISRAVSDAFNSKQAIAERNEKTALAIINLRKNELSQTGDMKNKAKMLKDAIAIGTKQFNAQAKNLNFSQTTRQLAKSYLENSLKQSSELIKENSYLKVVEHANSFLNIHNEKGEISGFKLFSAILNDGIKSAKDGLQNTLSKDNFYDFKNDFMKLAEKALNNGNVANYEDCTSLLPLSMALDEIIEGYGEQNGEKTMQAFANLSTQICQAIDSKDAGGIDAFQQRERFLLAVDKSTFCSSNQKCDIRAFLHDTNFILEYKNSNDAVKLMNSVLNFYPQPKYSNLHDALMNDFKSKFSAKKVEANTTKPIPSQMQASTPVFASKEEKEIAVQAYLEYFFSDVNDDISDKMLKNMMTFEQFVADMSLQEEVIQTKKESNALAMFDFAENTLRHGLNNFGNAFLPAGGLNSFLALNDYLNNIPSEDKALQDKTERLVNDYTKRTDTAIEKETINTELKQLAEIAQNIVTQGDAISNPDHEFYMRALNKMLKDDKVEEIAPFVSFLLGKSGLHLQSLNILKHHGLQGLSDQIDLNLITACAPGALSITKHPLGLRINCSDIITLQSFINKDGEAPKKVASLKVDHSVIIDRSQPLNADKDNDFIPSMRHDITLTTIPVEG